MKSSEGVFFLICVGKLLEHIGGNITRYKNNSEMRQYANFI